jgi:hypothetical protein
MQQASEPVPQRGSAQCEVIALGEVLRLRRGLRVKSCCGGDLT